MARPPNPFLPRAPAPPPPGVAPPGTWGEPNLALFERYVLTLNDASKECMYSLFHFLDQKTDHRINFEDFRKGSETHAEALVKWERIAANFDDNRDGHVDSHEFIRGIKRTALAALLETQLDAGSKLPDTHAEMREAINRSLNIAIDKIVSDIHAFVAPAVRFQRIQVPPTFLTMENAKFLGSHDEKLYVDSTNMAKLQELFRKLDQDGDGRLTDADFRASSQLKLWDTLKGTFDSIPDGIVTVEEFVGAFKLHIINTSCVDEQATLAQAWPPSNVVAIQALNKSINRQLTDFIETYEQGLVAEGFGK